MKRQLITVLSSLHFHRRVGDGCITIRVGKNLTTASGSSVLCFGLNVNIRMAAQSVSAQSEFIGIICSCG